MELVGNTHRRFLRTVRCVDIFTVHAGQQASGAVGYFSASFKNNNDGLKINR